MRRSRRAIPSSPRSSKPGRPCCRTEPWSIGETMVERLKDRTAIVTGAGQGIGAATARCFAAEGARVVVAEVNPETGTAMAAELKAAGAHAVFAPTDVTDPASVAATHDATRAA